jgi:hypothetical protein
METKPLVQLYSIFYLFASLSFLSHLRSDEADVSVLKDETSLRELLNDINYSVILAYWDKFREHLQVQEYTFNNLETHLLNKKSSMWSQPDLTHIDREDDA